MPKELISSSIIESTGQFDIKDQLFLISSIEYSINERTQILNLIRIYDTHSTLKI
ncbi:MAG: hypothetical protein ACUVWP_07635 [bacterium]